MIDAVKQANAKWDGKGAGNTRFGRIESAPENSQESKITNQAIHELDRLAGRPFFLTVSLPAPHALWEIGDPYYSMYSRSSIALPANRDFVEPADRSTAAWRFGQLLGEDGLHSILGRGWTLDNKLYTYRYWNKQNYNNSTTAINATRGVDKLNGYRQGR